MVLGAGGCAKESGPTASSPPSPAHSIDADADADSVADADPDADEPVASPPMTDQPSEPPMTDPRPSPELPEINREAYRGPHASVDVLQLESFPVQHVAAIEVRVPTGGWTLAIDAAAVVDGVAKVFVTLERPAADEMVTQAFVTLRERFTSVDPPFDRAEVFVHQAQRGVQTLTTNYRLAASR